ncbi:MAG: hypothetical protein JSV17_13105 [Candidatus Aminicenantes bacterium]|nr:MAG: hypothetical protein JSV17_13105 [Candidatus Aminicenantes bacterium]
MNLTKINPLVITVAVVIFGLCLCNACKKEEAPLTPEKLVREIFGRPEKVEDSGVISVEYEQPNCVIHYNFYPPGKSEYKEELGEELTAKLKKLFERDENIGTVQITIFGLSTDTYGNYGWKPTLYFEMDKETFDDTDWKKLRKKDLLEAVKNLKWFRKEGQAASDKLLDSSQQL